MALPHGRNKTGLTPKQALFVKEYLVDLNASQAAIRAGYSKKTSREQGSTLLTNINIQAALKKAMDDRADRTNITQDYVLNTIHETIERCRQVEQVYDRNGKPVFVKTQSGEEKTAFVFDAKSVLRGCELIGKHLGMFNEKLNIEHAGEINQCIKVVFEDGSPVSE